MRRWRSQIGGPLDRRTPRQIFGCGEQAEYVVRQLAGLEAAGGRSRQHDRHVRLALGQGEHARHGHEVHVEARMLPAQRPRAAGPGKWSRSRPGRRCGSNRSASRSASPTSLAAWCGGRFDELGVGHEALAGLGQLVALRAALEEGGSAGCPPAPRCAGTRSYGQRRAGAPRSCSLPARAMVRKYLRSFQSKPRIEAGRDWCLRTSAYADSFIEVHKQQCYGIANA